MNPSESSYQIPTQPEKESIPDKVRNIPDEAQQAWDKWLASLKQGDPGQQTRQEIKKMGDWVDLMGEKISKTVQSWVDFLGPRR